MSRKFTKEQRLQRALFQLIDGMFKHQYDIFYHQNLLAIAKLKRTHAWHCSSFENWAFYFRECSLLSAKIETSTAKLDRCKRAYANLIAKVVEEVSK